MSNDEAVQLMFKDFKHCCDMMKVREKELNKWIINQFLKPEIRKYAVRLFYRRSKPM